MLDVFFSCCASIHYLLNKYHRVIVIQCLQLELSTLNYGMKYAPNECNLLRSCKLLGHSLLKGNKELSSNVKYEQKIMCHYYWRHLKPQDYWIHSSMQNKLTNKVKLTLKSQINSTKIQKNYTKFLTSVNFDSDSRKININQWSLLYTLSGKKCHYFCL